MSKETKLTAEQLKAVKRAHAHGFSNFLVVMGRPKTDEKGKVEKSASGDIVRLDVAPKEAVELAIKGASYMEKFHGHQEDVKGLIQKNMKAA